MSDALGDGGTLRPADQIAELRGAERARAAPLFAGLNLHLAVPAVLAGQAAGAVYADSAIAPRSGLLLAGHRVYLAGDRGNEAFLAAVRSVLERRFIPDGHDSSGVVLYSDHPDWPAAAETALATGLNHYAERRRRFFQRDQKDGSASTTRPPEGFRLAVVDAALVHDPLLGNREALLEEMCSERESTADFLARSFGLALVHHDAVAGWCLSEYNLGHRCEVGIAIDEPFRRRGLATLMGGAFARQALAAGVSEIGWHCWEDNAASCATARALGFALIRDYTAHKVLLSRAPAAS